jgi:SAM-dependent methyltransferase
MQAWALEYLACPKSGTGLTLRDAVMRDGEIVGGTLVSKDGHQRYPIVNGVPRFVDASNYCGNFGLQWNTYARLRSDDYNGTTLIRDTILQRTGWQREHLTTKTLLECGCGCGNDTEVLLKLGAERILAFDLSNGVEAAQQHIRDPRVTFVQADIYRLPLRPLQFDIVFCHRMIQHTPDPERAFYSIVPHVRPGGEILLHSYDRHWLSMLHWKYLLRPLTKRMSPRLLLQLLRAFGVPLYAVQTPLQHWLGANKYLHFLISRLIPFYNYSHTYRAAGSCLTRRELFDVSLLDTFDALAPAYDLPNSAETIQQWFRRAGMTSIETTTRNPVFIKAIAPRTRVIEQRFSAGVTHGQVPAAGPFPASSQAGSAHS